jgi:fatty acid desaturase
MPSPEVNEQMMQTMTYNETGKWRENFDLAGWAKEIREVEKEQRSDKYHEEDVKHLKKILGWANMCYYGGLGVMFLLPQLGVAQAFGANVLGAFMMSTAICARWTMVGHHVCHGGYNAAMTEGNEIKGRFHRRKFARGPWNRIIDWMDWMMPEAWDVEHNHLHHYQLGEDADPDLVERNMKTTREGPMPMWARYMQVAALSVIWKWFYYAPNTMKELFARRAREAEKRGEESYQPYTTGSMPSTVLTTVQSAFQGNFGAIIETAKCFAPYATFQFGVLPAVGYAIGGAQMAMATLATTLLADLFTNLHSFIVIATNHVGDDIYRFESETKPRTDDFYMRAVIGSANFRTGGDVNDFMHGWLNYQIEHHMWPDMSMRCYQRAQPKVKAICEKYGMPYVQENVFKRVGQLVDVMVGKRTMLVWENGD